MWSMSLLYVVCTGVISDFFFLCVCVYKGGREGSVCVCF